MFSSADISSAISKMKNNKAVGSSVFTPELLKYFVNDEYHSFSECLCTLFNTFAMKGIPLSWNSLLITSLFKKGDKADPGNYRGLSVMQCLPKCFSMAL